MPGLKISGGATRMQVKYLAGSRQLRRQAAVLRPSIGKRANVADLGYRVGRARGWPAIDVWAGARDSTILIGPPGSGKGYHVIIPTIVDWPGPVLTTSTRPDNLAVTYHAREYVGPVAVFDPEGLGMSVGPRWPLARGCTDPATAMSRAHVLTGDVAGGKEDQYWVTQTKTVVQSLLMAAAYSGETVDLLRWSVDPARALEAAHILRSNSTPPGWLEGLESVLSAPEKRLSDVWSGVTNVFGALANPKVLAATSPTGAADTLDPPWMLANRGTLYLLGTHGGSSSTSRIIAALVDDVVTTARQMAARSPGGRLDPPLLLALDELANYPISGITGLASEGGGMGVCLLAVVQSMAQLRDRFGDRAAAAIFDASTVKIILGGSSSASDLHDLSRLIGERTDKTVSTSGQGVFVSGSRTVSERQVPILQPAELRQVPFGSAVVLLRSIPPFAVRLNPWTARPDAEELQIGKKQVEKTIQEGAQ